MNTVHANAGVVVAGDEVLSRLSTGLEKSGSIALQVQLHTSAELVTGIADRYSSWPCVDVAEVGYAFRRQETKTVCELRTGSRGNVFTRIFGARAGRTKQQQHYPQARADPPVQENSHLRMSVIGRCGAGFTRSGQRRF